MPSTASEQQLATPDRNPPPHVIGRQLLVGADRERVLVDEVVGMLSFESGCELALVRSIGTEDGTSTDAGLYRESPDDAANVTGVVLRTSVQMPCR